MTYTYRAGEDLDRLPCAPYVMREDVEPKPARHLTTK